jgi:hypothetical protein
VQLAEDFIEMELGNMSERIRLWAEWEREEQRGRAG